MLNILLLAAQLVSVPAPRDKLPPVASGARLSLVVADTVSETDPQALCPDGCLTLYRGTFRNAVVLAGPPLPERFAGRVLMGTPYNMSYRLAMIVEHRDGQEPLIRDQAGFGDRTHEACFENETVDTLAWQPQGDRILLRRKIICVRE